MDGGTDRALDYSRVSLERFPRSHWNAQICIHERFWLGALRSPLRVVEQGQRRGQQLPPSAKGSADLWSITAPRQPVNDLGTSKDPLAS